MHRQDSIDRFDFDKNRALDNEIGPIATLETNAFIYPRQYNLSLESQAGVRQLERETILIKTFKKPRPERFMNPDRHANHPTGQLPRHQSPVLFSAFSENSASSGYHGTSPQHERQDYPPNP